MRSASTKICARAGLVMLALAGGACVGGVPSTPPADGAAGDGRPVGADGGTDGADGLVPGSLQVSWIHGSASCAQDLDPEVQVHTYNATTHIIRQNKCRTFEAPFIYVLLGATSAGSRPSARSRSRSAARRIASASRRNARCHGSRR